MLVRAYNKMVLRALMGYRNISTEATYIIAGFTRVNLLTNEGKHVVEHDTRKEEDKQERVWQER